MAWADELRAPSKEGDSVPYVNFSQGNEWRVRVLAKPAQGYKLWVKSSNKPVVRRLLKDYTQEEMNDAQDDRYNPGMKRRPISFDVYPVYDYADGVLKMMEISQITIQRKLYGLMSDPDYGNLDKYDIVIKKSDGAKISYEVTPKPPKPSPKAEACANLFDIDMSFYFEPEKYAVVKKSEQKAAEKTETVDTDDIPF